MKKRITLWIATLAILATAAALLLWSYTTHHADLTSEASGDAAIKNPAKVAREGGEPVVTLDDDVQERMGVKAEPHSSYDAPPASSSLWCARRRSRRGFRITRSCDRNHSGRRE